jgi:hypothetical protein
MSGAITQQLSFSNKVEISIWSEENYILTFKFNTVNELVEISIYSHSSNKQQINIGLSFKDFIENLYNVFEKRR